MKAFTVIDLNCPQEFINELHAHCSEYNEDIFYFEDETFHALLTAYPETFAKCLEYRRRFEVVSGIVERGTLYSVGYDLFCAEPHRIHLKPFETRALSTGVRSIMSPDLCAIVKEKSGLALKGLRVGGGVIDADYRDEWKVICTAFEPLFIDPGAKLAQFKIEVVPIIDLVGVRFKNVQRTGGFGSTGAT